MQIELTIREYLISHGITQAFIARKCGWSKQRANALFTGKQRLLFEDGLKVCEALGLPYDYFCNTAKAEQNSS